MHVCRIWSAVSKPWLPHSTQPCWTGTPRVNRTSWVSILFCNATQRKTFTFIGALIFHRYLWYELIMPGLCRNLYIDDEGKVCRASHLHVITELTVSVEQLYKGISCLSCRKKTESGQAWWSCVTSFMLYSFFNIWPHELFGSLSSFQSHLINSASFCAWMEITPIPPLKNISFLWSTNKWVTITERKIIFVQTTSNTWVILYLHIITNFPECYSTISR